MRKSSRGTDRRDSGRWFIAGECSVAPIRQQGRFRKVGRGQNQTRPVLHEENPHGRAARHLWQTTRLPASHDRKAIHFNLFVSNRISTGASKMSATKARAFDPGVFGLLDRSQAGCYWR